MKKNRKGEIIKGGASAPLSNAFFITVLSSSFLFASSFLAIVAVEKVSLLPSHTNREEKG